MHTHTAQHSKAEFSSAALHCESYVCRTAPLGAMVTTCGAVRGASGVGVHCATRHQTPHDALPCANVSHVCVYEHAFNKNAVFVAHQTSDSSSSTSSSFIGRMSFSGHALTHHTSRTRSFMRASRRNINNIANGFYICVESNSRSRAHSIPAHHRTTTTTTTWPFIHAHRRGRHSICARCAIRQMSSASCRRMCRICI